jgi:hypothetical protein
MPKKSAGTMNGVSVNTMGKPTEKTGVPQPNMGVKHSVLDGIVKGVARNTHTPYMDGLVKSACEHKGMDKGIHSVRPSATKFGEQQFGSVPFADARLGKKQ